MTDTETQYYKCRNCGSQVVICQKDTVWTLCQCGKRIFNEAFWYYREDGVVDRK